MHQRFLNFLLLKCGAHSEWSNAAPIARVSVWTYGETRWCFQGHRVLILTRPIPEDMRSGNLRRQLCVSGRAGKHYGGLKKNLLEKYRVQYRCINNRHSLHPMDKFDRYWTVISFHALFSAGHRQIATILKIYIYILYQHHEPTEPNTLFVSMPAYH